MKGQDGENTFYLFKETQAVRLGTSARMSVYSFQNRRIENKMRRQSTNSNLTHLKPLLFLAFAFIIQPLSSIYIRFKSYPIFMCLVPSLWS